MNTVHDHLQALWDQLEKPAAASGPIPVLWTPAYTPLFPEAWPPGAATAWLRYGYAQGQDLNLRDGVRVARPWVRVIFHRDDAPVIVPLMDRLVVLGAQGVRPLTAGELALLQTGGAVEAHARRLTALPAPHTPGVAELHAYYRLWLKLNGVIVGVVRSSHQNFFQWLIADGG